MVIPVVILMKLTRAQCHFVYVLHSNTLSFNSCYCFVCLSCFLFLVNIWQRFVITELCLFPYEGLPVMSHRCYSVFICKNQVQCFTHIPHLNFHFSIGNRRWLWVMQVYIILWGVWRAQREYDFIITGGNWNRGNCEKSCSSSSVLVFPFTSRLTLLLCEIVYSNLCHWVCKLSEVLNDTVIPVCTLLSYPRRLKSSLQLWEHEITHLLFCFELFIATVEN
jgi:hypothetical protein